MAYLKIHLKKGQKVWYTSDTHYGHSNICRGTSSWDLKEHGGHDSVRDFDTLEDMNQAIVDGINKHVKEDDYMFHNGDWSFGGIYNIAKFRQQLFCKNIILIHGNHDTHIILNKVLPNSKFRAAELFTGTYDYLEVTIVDYIFRKETYSLFHFPITIWNKAHKDRPHLYGHVHGGYEAPSISLDVGIDNAFKLLGEYRPFSQQEVTKFLSKKSYIKMSHHNKNTN